MLRARNAFRGGLCSFFLIADIFEGRTPRRLWELISVFEVEDSGLGATEHFHHPRGRQYRSGTWTVSGADWMK